MPLTLVEALDYLREGDTLVVWKLDRLGRSLSHLIDVVQGLHARGAGFRTLQEKVDTTSAGGKLIFHVFGALAEFERELVRERTMAGLKAARIRGRLGGRRRRMTRQQIIQAAKLLDDPDCDVAEICQTFGVHRTTLYRNVKRLVGVGAGSCPSVSGTVSREGEVVKRAIGVLVIAWCFFGMAAFAEDVSLQQTVYANDHRTYL